MVCYRKCTESLLIRIDNKYARLNAFSFNRAYKIQKYRVKMSCRRHQLPHDLQKTMYKFKKSLGLGKKEKPLALFTVQGFLVEHRGFEPLTSTLRTLRATNCANAPYSVQYQPHRLTQYIITQSAKDCKPFFHEI